MARPPRPTTWVEGPVAERPEAAQADGPPGTSPSGTRDQRALRPARRRDDGGRRTIIVAGHHHSSASFILHPSPSPVVASPPSPVVVSPPLPPPLSLVVRRPPSCFLPLAVRVLCFVLLERLADVRGAVISLSSIVIVHCLFGSKPPG